MQLSKRREKRYLLLMPEYVMGGAETQFRYLIEYAERTKWNLDVIIEHRFKRDDTLLAKDMARMKHVRFYEMGSSENGDERIVQYVTSHILKNILHIKYDACLIHHAPDIVLAPILRRFGIHVIYSERVDAADILKNPYRIKCLRYCNKILANAVYAQTKLQKQTGREVNLIRNGKPFVKKLPMKENREIDRILVPCRIVPPKNQMLMLHYLREYPYFKGKVAFAGMLEDKPYQRKLERFVRQNGLQGQVEFLGCVEDMRSEYERADLIVLPSLAEGTPNVVLEAYAYGRPVIVSDIETERDVVRNPRLRFKVNDISELDTCIKYIRELPDEEYGHLLEENREFVLRNYNIDKMVKNFYKVMTGSHDRKS